MARFVLVHGAAHGAWCWRRLLPLLTAAGHEVRAPDLPAAGDDPRDAAGVTLADYLACVLDAVGEAGPPCALVGHSMGGLCATLAAEAAPERVACAVYLTAFMLRDGERARDVTLLKAAPAVMQAIDFEADPGGRTYRYRPEAAARVFYQDCTAADAADAARRLRPMPRAIAQTPVHWSAERAGRVPRVYVQCAADLAIPLRLQRLMCERLPPARTLVMACGHSPFLAAPRALAERLDEVAREFCGR